MCRDVSCTPCRCGHYLIFDPPGNLGSGGFFSKTASGAGRHAPRYRSHPATSSASANRRFAVRFLIIRPWGRRSVRAACVTRPNQAFGRCMPRRPAISHPPPTRSTRQVAAGEESAFSSLRRDDDLVLDRPGLTPGPLRRAKAASARPCSIRL